MADNFADRLRDFRKKAGLSQSELAYLVGVHEATIRRWELQQRQPHSDEIKKLAEALHVSENDLLNGAPPETWVLQIKVANSYKEDFIDMSKKIPTVSSITTTPEGGFLCLGGNYDLWQDDNLFKKMMADLKKYRATVIQNGIALGGIKN